MKKFLTLLAKKLWPDVDTLAEPDRVSLLGELFGTLYTLPFVIVGLGWLMRETNLDLVYRQWPILLLLLGLSFIFSRLSFFQITGNRAGSYSYEGNDLEAIVIVSATLLFGPTAIWLHVLNILGTYGTKWPRFASRYQWWNWIRNLIANMGIETVSFLLSLRAYQWLGGHFPLQNLTLTVLWPALLAVLIFVLLNELFFWSMWAFRIYFQLISQLLQDNLAELNRQIIKFLLVSNIPIFFGILAAALYTQMGLGAYLFLMGGILLASLLARRLSQTLVLSQQRSRELAQLEQLGRAIFAALPADTSCLPRLLEIYVPKMFQYRQVEIRLFSGQILLQLPQDMPLISEDIWTWWIPDPQPIHFVPGCKLPWTREPTIYPVVLTPILSTQEAKSLGGICLVLESIHFEDVVTDLRPALQVLSEQIASALHRAEVYRQTLEHQKLTQELALAWQVQASFIPETLPKIEGWQLTAILKPCKETSGDFYDVIQLPNSYLGLVIADVTDKGMGAALFMALSQTLIRTYAREYLTRPDLVLAATNRRILTDTRNKMFVTVFYGILDPATGRLVYANAGHNPPYLLKAQPPSKLQSLPKSQGLRNTGMPLGILEEASWEAKTVELAPSDMLILYTDGITETPNQQDELFGDQRLLVAAQANSESPIQVIQDSILTWVDQFSEESHQCDDVTLMLLKRE
ncbi:PP2C family protein-serine/threonine phosphatase [Anaerolineales bacterium HSG24]|nr:PP2C family protein-serine/threonine phosphatase [Anaerolineales bacterium HSG24]